MDLLFPHHECEIAQNVAGYGKPSVRYWMHNNMITINGQKMGRSLGNFITLNQFFSGEHALLQQTYSPMTIRFFILQAHYRSPLDFSNEALQGSEKGLQRMLKTLQDLEKIEAAAESSVDVKALAERCGEAMLDDMNTPVLIAHLFEAVKWINGIMEGRVTIDREDLELLKTLFHTYLFEILGLIPTGDKESDRELTGNLVEMILALRQEAKASRDFEAADRIREGLSRLGIVVKDRKEGADWEFN